MDNISILGRYIILLQFSILRFRNLFLPFYFPELHIMFHQIRMHEHEKQHDGSSSTHIWVNQRSILDS